MFIYYFYSTTSNITNSNYGLPASLALRVVELNCSVLQFHTLLVLQTPIPEQNCLFLVLSMLSHNYGGTEWVFLLQSEGTTRY